MVYRVLVTGSRDWTDWALVGIALADACKRAEPDPVIIVHGDCPTGGDAIAERWARQHGVATEPHAADWREFGRAAGPIRNRLMVNLGADECVAFIRNQSRGATHCAEVAEQAGIPVRRWTA